MLVSIASESQRITEKEAKLVCFRLRLQSWLNCPPTRSHFHTAQQVCIALNKCRWAQLKLLINHSPKLAQVSDFIHHCVDLQLSAHHHGSLFIAASGEGRLRGFSFLEEMVLWNSGENGSVLGYIVPSKALNQTPMVEHQAFVCFSTTACDALFCLYGERGWVSTSLVFSGPCTLFLWPWKFWQQ